MCLIDETQLRYRLDGQTLLKANIIIRSEFDRSLRNAHNNSIAL